MKIILLLLVIVTLLCPGCTVVSANRVFPKLSWYWSADAKEQRRERAADKQTIKPTSFATPYWYGHLAFYPEGVVDLTKADQYTAQRAYDNYIASFTYQSHYKK